MTTNLALVTIGHSQYDDTLWGWLNKHREWFDGPEDLADDFDYWRSWVLLALAGCEFERVDSHDSSLVMYISFDGTVDELIQRMDALMP